MRWEIETWRKLYIRVDARWLALDLSARGLADELLKYADAEGHIELGTKDGSHSAAADSLGRLLSAKRHESKRIRSDVTALLEDGFVMIDKGGLRIRNFVEAQSWVKASTLRMRTLRAKADGVTCDAEVTAMTRHKVTVPVPVPVPVPVMDLPLPPSGPEMLSEDAELGDAHRARFDSVVMNTGAKLDIDEEWAKFKAKARETLKLSADWPASWSYWLSNAAKYAKKDALREAARADKPPRVVYRDGKPDTGGVPYLRGPKEVPLEGPPVTGAEAAASVAGLFQPRRIA